MQDLVDEALECLCGIAEAERHAQELEQTKWSNYRCFWDVLWLNWYLVVGADEVDFGEDVVPLREMEKSCMCGMGYLSGIEAWLSAR